MDRFYKNRWFILSVYSLLGLINLYFLFMMRPLLGQICDFIKSVLAPFFISIIIAYVLHPIVTLLHERKVPRIMAVLLIYIIFFVVVTVILINIMPMLLKQFGELNHQMPQLHAKVEQLMDGMTKTIPTSIHSSLYDAIYMLEERVGKIATEFMNNIGKTLNMLVVALIIPFVIFYILKDFDLFERAIIACVPRTHRKHVISMCREIDIALGSYIRGQCYVCIIIGILAYVGYWLIGIPYPLLLAVFVAVFNIIPYLGPYFGAGPALIVAMTISFKMVMFVIVVNTVCQIIEGNIISPQIVGKTLHMHPLSIIFALLVGGELAGIVGLILAVPFYAVVKVILHHVITYFIHRRTI